MAKQVITKLLDDLDGGAADETVTFSVDGVEYEIDLSEKNAAKLRDFLEPFQAAATRVGRRSGFQTPQRSRGGNTGGAGRELNQKIRAWAGSNGYQLSERGRIPQEIQDAYSSGTPHPAKAADDKAAAIAEEAKPKRAAARPAKKAAPASFSE